MGTNKMAGIKTEIWRAWITKYMPICESDFSLLTRKYLQKLFFWVTNSTL